MQTAFTIIVSVSLLSIVLAAVWGGFHDRFKNIRLVEEQETEEVQDVDTPIDWEHGC